MFIQLPSVAKDCDFTYLTTSSDVFHHTVLNTATYVEKEVNRKVALEVQLGMKGGTMELLTLL